MSQPIITTNVSKMKSVFLDVQENINKFHELKKLFAHGKEYTILAEPVLDANQKVTWHTEFDGQPTAYSRLTQDEKDMARGRIKYQVNRLYKAAYKLLLKDNKEDISNFFELLDSCFEIPSYDEIFRIQDAQGRTNFVIIKWGFRGDEYSQNVKLIKKLVPTKVADIKVKVFKNQKIASNQEVVASVLGRQFKLSTDSYGYVTIEDVPLGQSFKLYSKDMQVSAEYECDGQDDYQFDIGGHCLVNMNFHVIDQENNPIPNTELNYSYENKQGSVFTDAFGCFVLEDIPENAQILITQKEASQTFVCNSSTDEYEFVGSKDGVQIKVTIIDEATGKIIPSKVQFAFNNRLLEIDCDQDGIAILDNIPVDTEFEISCNNQYYSSNPISLTTKMGENTVEIFVIKKNLQGSMVVKVLDQKGAIIQGTIIRSQYNNQKIDKTTDENGLIYLDDVSYDSQVVCTQIVNQLACVRHTFVFTRDNDQYILKGKNIPSKSAITRLTILAQNNKKQGIPNLRISIDDNHLVLNKITNKEGVVVVDDLMRNKVYHLSTDYKNHITKTDYICTQDEETVTLSCGTSKYAYLIWLIPLAAIFLFLLGKFLYPVIDNYIETNKREAFIADSLEQVRRDSLYQDSLAKLQPKVVEPQGLTLTLFNQELNQAINNAYVEVLMDSLTFVGSTDEQGKINFDKIPEIEGKKLSCHIKKDDQDYANIDFTFSKYKTINLTNQSIEQMDELLNCGQTIANGNYQISHKTFDMKKTSGKFRLRYCTFNNADQIIVYKGLASQASDDDILFSTKTAIKTGKNYKDAWIDLNNTDGIVSIKVIANQGEKVQWYYGVNCVSSSKPAKSEKKTAE